MPSPKLFPRQRLQGASVLLSVGIPDPEHSDTYRRVPEAALRIEEAVISVARAVFVEGGTLVLSVQPGISTVIARVVAHYYLPAAAENIGVPTRRQNRDQSWTNPSVVMYQSKILEEDWIEASQRLTRHPLVRFQWTDAAREEVNAPATSAQPQMSESMERMRRTMIKDTSPLALVVMGGTGATQAEAELFTATFPDRPVFALPTTGGVAALLLDQQQFINDLRTPDLETEGLVDRYWAGQESSEPRRSFSQENSPYYVPYAFIAQQIVTQIVKGLG